ncbi:putative hydrolase [Ketogulonicigenium robustum]|uniref:Putative hydrolase n=2 Tax=Ketogulonicigenium robustum TaxID=92947 RepID=A0A1W6NY63_9RHOB|nr:putative hydrolase [Ketogulonicigenium robustum]
MQMDTVDTWVFDLDNTLYPPEATLFDQIRLRMRDYVMRELSVGADEADLLRDSYWHRYGTTLAGLMSEHHIAPEPFLDEVHDIDFSCLCADVQLAADIRALPGRKIVFTNAARGYAQKVLAARGLADLFEGVYGISETDYRPKPEAAAYQSVIAATGFDPRRAAMFEDDPRNLIVPHQLGMRTVLVGGAESGPHVDYEVSDVGHFLADLHRGV